MEGKEIRATPLSSSLPSALLSARAEQGRGKEDHAPPSTGLPTSYHLLLPFQQPQDSLQNQIRLFLNLKSSVSLSQMTPGSSLVSLPQGIFLVLERVRVALCQGG